MAIADERAAVAEILRAEMARRSSPHYLRMARIEDAHRGLIDIEPWPHLMERAAAWQQGDSEIILKARQLGISWLAAAYAAWRATYQPGSMILLLSAGQREAFALLDKVRVVLMHHRTGAADLDTDAAGELAVRGGGRIVALPSTESAGRGYTASLVIADEAAYHPYAERNYAAYRPAMADGGQLLILSTANGAAGWFHDLYWAAERGELPIRAAFIPWHARPGRDADWLARERAAYGGLPAQFAQEYPASAGEAFVAHSGLVYGLDPLTGEPIFHPPRNIGPAPVPWAECKWRLASVDPGGGDPTAVLPLGVSATEHMHIYGEMYRRGPTGAEELSEYLGRLHRAGPLDLVLVDPSQGSLIATLRSLGWNAHPANNDKADGIATVSTWLRNGRLTIAPECTNLLAEFSTYWWAERREMQAGSPRPTATRTPASHHADALDALRYAVLGVIKGLPRSTGRIEQGWDRAERERARPEPLAERLQRKRSTA